MNNINIKITDEEYVLERVERRVNCTIQKLSDCGCDCENFVSMIQGLVFDMLTYL